MTDRRSTSRGRRSSVAAVALLSAGILAACSPSGASSTSGGEQADVAGAKAFIAKWEAPQTTFGLPPMKAAPPRGKRIALIHNNTPNSRSNLQGEQAAAAALGWTTIPFVFDPGTPTGLQDAYAQALAANPDGVVTAGQDLKDFAATARQFAAKQIPVVTSATADPVAPPLIANVTDGNQTALAARIIANYIVAQKGAKANVVMFSIPSFSVLEIFEKSFAEEFHRRCPGCPFKAVPVQITDIGTKLPAQVVSAVQADPGITYAVMGFGAISTGVSAALRAAGSSEVKIAGEAPDLQNIGNLRTGAEDMWVGYPLFGMGWKSIDALARHFAGEPTEVDTTSAAPFRILTKANAPQPAALPEVADYPDYFKKLWHVR
ncbi:sugar ABC transporter substrate-binding protein [Amycolatopsis jejuensis]|uniref:sugar ABC transporter substrate-binding protein n=1 Tax=Amycolatopsis jejuensis TaxID=330084 RepID=UPI000526BC91|nr:substrate-binding domain-containing protein [Amycolatopsis jejuensis]